MKRRHEFVAGDDDEGTRLDRLIARRPPELSRGLARRAIGAGAVFVDKKRVKVASRSVHTGQRVTIHRGPWLEQTPAGTASFPEASPAPLVVAKTDDYLVIDKPSGLFSAPTPEGDQSDVLFHLREHGALHLVHRLDRPTSGLMVLARHRRAAGWLSRQLEERTMGRRYRAILLGRLPDSEVEVNREVGGRPAVTHFELLQQRSEATLVRATLQTGRTHQIRQHAEMLGAPVAGDSKYGRTRARRLPQRCPRLALHAERLWFEDGSGKTLQFQSPFPAELAAFWDALDEE